MTATDLASLRDDLDAAGFTVDGLTALWGGAADAALHRGDRVPALRAVDRAGRVPVAVLARAFVLGMPTSADALAAALPSVGVDGALRLGLVTSDDAAGGIGPLLDLRPYSFVDALGVGSWWIASDPGELSTGGPLAEDHVLGVGGASLTLSGLMVETPVATALDLGTGCGIQAMHASRHAARVVATDISARALAIAAVNAELNGIRTIEFRLGDLFEPVAGERFDHIVSNPPFVITPRSAGVPEYEYRDGGMTGDDLVATVIRGCADHLADGGIAQLLGNWEYRGARPGLERVRSWVQQLPEVDSWVIERDRQDAAAYAETWIRDGGTRPGARSDELIAAWLDDFEARDATAVGFGYITLRRSGSNAPLHRFEHLDGPLGHSAAGLGGGIAASLAAHDWLAGHDLDSARLVVAGDVTEERHYWPGAEHPTVMTLRQGGGFGRSHPLDTALAGFVGACDGELTTRAIIDALAQLLDADADALAADLHPAIHELVFTGFLAPA